MRYDDKDRESSNLEDRRGQGGGSPFGRGGFRIPMGGGGGGRGGFSLTTLLIVGALMLFFGVNPLDILRGGVGGGGTGGIDFPQFPKADPGPRTSQNPFEIPGLPGGGTANVDPGQDEMKKFVGRVLADTEDVWNQIFQSFGRKYEEPKLVIFSGAFPTACGTGQAAMGPFYCPLDRKIYIDLTFYEELKRRFRAPGDFAQAYVIAHEVGHHVQTILGISEKVQQAKQRVRSERESNQIQVRMELQADCLAGVWAARNHQLKNRLEPGDIEEGLRAAAAIGDDMIQRQQTGRVVPDAFTHGSSEQRVRWFRKGLETAQIRDCDTFNAQNL